MLYFQLVKILYIFSGMSKTVKIIIGVLIVVILIASNFITKTDWYKGEKERVAQIDSIKAANKSGEILRNMIPQNQGADGVVWQVQEYLKGSLHDPSSYDPVQWGSVQTSDSITFRVSHTYRAKNRLGALVKETKVFTLDRVGKVVSAD